ncbi:SWIM zinc finger domain-containing protein, partial [Streptomyces sp. NPDC056601]
MWHETRWDSARASCGRWLVDGPWSGVWALGAVSGLEVGDGAVFARVQGSDVYEVELTLGEGTGIGVSGWCDCPYGQEGNFCKHCVAVGLTVLRQVVVPRQRAAARARALGLEPWLAQLSRDELVALVQEQVAGDRELRRRLELRAAAAHGDVDTLREPSPHFWRRPNADPAALLGAAFQLLGPGANPGGPGRGPLRTLYRTSGRLHQGSVEGRPPRRSPPVAIRRTALRSGAAGGGLHRSAGRRSSGAADAPGLCGCCRESSPRLPQPPHRVDRRPCSQGRAGLPTRHTRRAARSSGRPSDVGRPTRCRAPNGRRA